MMSEAESPWQRLPWTLASALLAWAILLWAFGEFLSRPGTVLPVQKPIDAKLIEMPAPPNPAQQRPAPPSPRVARPEPVPRKVEARSETRREAPQKAQPRVEPPKAVAPPPPPSPPPTPQQGAPGGDEMGARAIYSPRPQIPDEFRRDTMDVPVVARFHIAADGAAKVELITATPYPDLNRSVLETLGTWRFFPAMKAGKPVASVQDVRFHLLVK